MGYLKYINQENMRTIEAAKKDIEKKVIEQYKQAEAKLGVVESIGSSCTHCYLQYCPSKTIEAYKTKAIYEILISNIAKNIELKKAEKYEEDKEYNEEKRKEFLDLYNEDLRIEKEKLKKHEEKMEKIETEEFLEVLKLLNEPKKLHGLKPEFVEFRRTALKETRKKIMETDKK